MPHTDLSKRRKRGGMKERVRELREHYPALNISEKMGFSGKMGASEKVFRPAPRKRRGSPMKQGKMKGY